MLSREAKFWLLAVAGLFFMLWLLGDVLLPFVAGIALAYLLDPIADWLEDRGLPRTVATLLILGTFLLALLLLVVLLYPIVAGQIAGLVRRLPDLLDQLRERLRPLWQDLIESMPGDGMQRMQSAVANNAEKAVDIAAGLVTGLLASGAAIINIVALVVITPVVAFYMLRDWDRVVTLIDDSLPRHRAETIREQMREIDRVLAGFVRGQLMVCTLLGGFYAIGLSIIGLDFGLVIGLASGALSVIPYVGTLTGFLATAIVATIQFWDTQWMIAIALGIFALGQFLEGNIVTPLLVGDRVGLHPVWLMFALLAFGSLFGFVGVLIAVPAAAVVGVLVRFGLAHYRASRLYHGSEG